eukprot:CAMPEP_0115465848 /NCGR_PEP_ID=MMETSP0271-20121206/49612_1 /TAXON_ID=71861 /ORGANISM="Scrippsiella trochoidea, Strain CCMP3099" /LENGTH=35 /DNA_ID= /DNA_START= /DNA_END= /DNA_ORIENTATION=
MSDWQMPALAFGATSANPPKNSNEAGAKAFIILAI